MTTTAALLDEARRVAPHLSPDVVEVHQYARTATIVDVRTEQQVAEDGWIAGAVHVPRAMLEFVADPTSALYAPVLDPARATVVYCTTGAQAALAALRLHELGYAEVAVLDGGLQAWRRAGRPVAGTKDWHTPPTSLASAGVNPCTQEHDDEEHAI